MECVVVLSNIIIVSGWIDIQCSILRSLVLVYVNMVVMASIMMHVQYSSN